MKKHVDFLVIGSGIGGLSFALKVATHGKVCVISKVEASETNTRYAQGGIASVMALPDSFEKHVRDTIKCGHGVSDPAIVNMVIKEGPERIADLVTWGVAFDKDGGGRYHLSKEGGHSEHRVLHHKDQTGNEIEQKLLNKAKEHPNIELLENHFTIDILTQHHMGILVNRQTHNISCYGAYVLDKSTGVIKTILSKITMMATGGAGSVYSVTTNPLIATGDGIAMVYRAKGKIENMEFMQFHPTSLYNPAERPSFLITEALRGFGAILKTKDGKEFMHKYDARGSLAPRDIAALAIDAELKTRGDQYVYLDCRHLKAKGLQENFPNIYSKCKTIGLDMNTDLIPVVPGAHYICGGIAVDEFGRSTIHQLYATGECACTHLHGANRLASNSLLEALVFSHRAAISSAHALGRVEYCKSIPDWNAEGMVLTEEMVLITHAYKELRSIMSNYVGIVRSDIRLKRAFDRLEIIFRETEELYNRSIISTEICELRNLVNIAYLIIKAAMERKESRGLHYSIDYPEIKD